MKKRFGRVEKALALFGKTSLFIYVAQYFLVHTVPSFIGWRNQMNAMEMILYSGGMLMILYYLAHIYNNSFLKRRPRPASYDLPPELLALKKDLW